MSSDRDQQFWRQQWTSRSGAANPFVRVVEQHVPAGSGKKLLDLGCGDGRDAVALAALGFAITAIDYAESGIAKLKASHPQINAMQADIRNLSFPAQVFDAVYAHLSLHYFDDATTQRIFSQIHALLKPDGWFFVKCKSTADPLYGKGKKISSDIFEEGHVRHFFSEAYMRLMLKDFNVVHLTSSHDQYDGHESAFVEAVAQKT